MEKKLTKKEIRELTEDLNKCFIELAKLRIELKETFNDVDKTIVKIFIDKTSSEISYLKQILKIK